MGEIKKVYRFSVGNTEEKIPVRKPKNRWRNILNNIVT
jgi:hypothetical protein